MRLPSFSRRQLFFAGLLLLIVMSAAGAVCWHFRTEIGNTAGEVRNWVLVNLRMLPPFLFLLAFALTPLLLVPITPFYFTAGVYGLWQGIVIIWVGLAINIALSYWIAHGFLRPYLENFLKKRHYTIPRVEQGNALRLILVLRMAPGLPFPIQNYLLGLSGVPFRMYFLWSMGLQIGVAAMMVNAGESILQGNFGQAMTAIGLLVAAVCAIGYLRKQYASPSSASPAATE